MQHLPGEPDIEIGYRLLIPVVHVGALIGRGGEAIAQLRQRTGARVKVHDAHDSESRTHLHLHPGLSFGKVALLCMCLAASTANLLVAFADEYAACTADCTLTVPLCVACLYVSCTWCFHMQDTCKQQSCKSTVCCANGKAVCSQARPDQPLCRVACCTSLRFVRF